MFPSFVIPCSPVHLFDILLDLHGVTPGFHNFFIALLSAHLLLPEEMESRCDLFHPKRFCSCIRFGDRTRKK